MVEVVALCKGCVGEVFGTADAGAGANANANANANEQAGAEGQEYRPVGGDAVYAESLQAAGRKKEAPHLSAFEKLTLLGT